MNVVTSCLYNLPYNNNWRVRNIQQNQKYMGDTLTKIFSWKDTKLVRK